MLLIVFLFVSTSSKLNNGIVQSGAKRQTLVIGFLSLLHSTQKVGTSPPKDSKMYDERRDMLLEPYLDEYEFAYGAP